MRGGWLVGGRREGRFERGELGYLGGEGKKIFSVEAARSFREARVEGVN